MMRTSSKYTSQAYVYKVIQESESLLGSFYVIPQPHHQDFAIRETNQKTRSYHPNGTITESHDDFFNGPGLHDRFQSRSKTIEMANPYFAEERKDLGETIKKGGIMIDYNSHLKSSKDESQKNSPNKVDSDNKTFERRTTKDDRIFENPLVVHNQDNDYQEENIEDYSDQKKIKKSTDPLDIEIYNKIPKENISELERKLENLGEFVGNLKKEVNILSEQKNDNLKPKIEYLDEEIKNVKNKVVSHLEYDHRAIKTTSWCC